MTEYIWELLAEDKGEIEGGINGSLMVGAGCSYRIAMFVLRSPGGRR